MEGQKDHDLLVRLDEKMNNVIQTVNNFTATASNIEMRLQKLEGQDNRIIGGWKMLVFVLGTAAGFISLFLQVFFKNGK